MGLARRHPGCSGVPSLTGLTACLPSCPPLLRNPPWLPAYHSPEPQPLHQCLHPESLIHAPPTPGSFLWAHVVLTVCRGERKINTKVQAYFIVRGFEDAAFLTHCRLWPPRLSVTFPTVSAHFACPCHILVILIIFPNFLTTITFVMMICDQRLQLAESPDDG